MNISIIGSTQCYGDVTYGLEEYNLALDKISLLVHNHIVSYRNQVSKDKPNFIFCGSPLSDCMTLEIASKLYENPNIKYYLPCENDIVLKDVKEINILTIEPIVFPGQKIMKEYNRLPSIEKDYFLNLYNTYGFSTTTVYNGHTERNNEVSKIVDLLICVTTMSHDTFFDDSTSSNSGTKYVYSNCKGIKYHYSIIDKSIRY